MMKTWLTTLALSASLVSPMGLAQQNDFKRLNDQLEIFTGILETAAEQENGESDQLTNVRYTYLRNQGVVFRTRLGRSTWELVRPDIPEPPMPPEAEEMGEFARDLQLDVVVEKGLRTAHKILSKLSGEYSEEWFELTEQQRDLAWDIRDQEREIRDLEFQKRSVEGEEKQQLEQELSKLNEELEVLRSERQQVREQAEALKKELKAKREQVREKQVANRNQAIGKVEQLISRTLCDYGVTLKALPDDEYISFVIEGADLQPDNSRRDRVYVFELEDVRSCESTADANDLLQSASPYYF